MYQFAYSYVCDELTSHDVPTARRLADAVELLDALDERDVPLHYRHEALSEFRKIWVAVADDLPGEQASRDPSQFKNDVLQEIERRRFRRAQTMLASRFFSGSGVQ